MSKRVLVTCRQMQRTLHLYMDWFSARDITAETVPVAQQLTEAELIPIIGQYDGIIAGDDFITAAVIEAARPRLKVICKWGIGTDSIDKVAAQAAGIPVYNTPGMFGDEVADVAMGYMLMLARSLHLIDRAAHAGEWLKIEGETLAGRIVGIIGLGSIGRAIVRRVRAHGCAAISHDIMPLSDAEQARLGIEQQPLDALLATSDYVVLACPLTPENHHLIDHRRLALMKPGARLVNVARGPLVEEAALVGALDSGHLAGAALDVFEIEPIRADNPLCGRPNVILGAHNGSNTRQGVLRTNQAALDNLWRGLQGG